MSETKTLPTLLRDRLGKLPHIVRHEVCLDEDSAQAYLLAKAALDTKVGELTRTLARRLAVARTGAGDDVKARQAAEDLVHVGDADEVATLEAALSAAVLAWDDQRLRFVIRSLGRKRWDAIRKENPPGRDEREAWRLAELPGKPGFDSEGVARALLAEAVIDPVLAPEDIDDIVSGTSWNETEFGLLWAALLAAQTQARSVDRASRPVVTGQDGARS